ncbi:MAG: prolipoprotein diacylglyceryl transferase [Anaerolineae bacterium]|nr:prolipoprotein diacylglyceryl transferase [Anaerolineae bacterium]
MTLHREGLEIGPFDLFGLTINPTLHFYGLIIVVGILTAAGLAAWMARRDKKDPDHVWNGIIWVVILGVIVARLWHVLFPSVSSVEAGRDAAWYLSHPFDLHDGPLIIWSGGLSIFGAVIGGMLGVFLYARKNRLDLMAWMDIGVVVLPLGQAIGRWANYINQELYGKPTDLPWGMRIDNPPIEYIEHTHFHPLFLYESLWNLAVAGALLYLWLNYRDRTKRGSLLLLYLIAYPIARFFLEYLRIEVTMANGVNVSQAFSAAVALIAAGVLLYTYRDSLRSRRHTSTSEAHDPPA